MTRRDSGVVVRAGKGYAVVLTSDGRFLRVRSSGIPPMVGEEISLPSPFASWTSWTRWVPAAALACIMVFMSFFGYTKYIQAKPAAAYVSIDSSGSVELEVNDRGLVKSAKAFDDEGQKLLSQVDYQFQPIDKVVEAMAEVESKKGSSGFIVGFTPIEETPPVEKIEAKVREKVGKASAKFKAPSAEPKPDPGKTGDGETNPLVNTFRFTLENRERARALSMSPGRLFIWSLLLGQQGSSQPQPGQGTGPDGTPVVPGPGPDNLGTAGGPGGKGEPGKPGDSTGQPGGAVGESRPGPHLGDSSPSQGFLDFLSEERVKSGFPQVSDLEQFLKALEEHKDEKKLNELLDEVLDLFEKGKEGSDNGNGKGGVGNGEDSGKREPDKEGSDDGPPGKTATGNGQGTQGANEGSGGSGKTGSGKGGTGGGKGGWPGTGGKPGDGKGGKTKPGKDTSDTKEGPDGNFEPGEGVQPERDTNTDQDTSGEIPALPGLTLGTLPGVAPGEAPGRAPSSAPGESLGTFPGKNSLPDIEELLREIIKKIGL